MGRKATAYTLVRIAEVGLTMNVLYRDFLKCGLQFGDIARNDADVGAFFSEEEGDALAHALGAARDDDCLVCTVS